jgi:3-oxoacyl-[acyl-carrier protein] reductase
MLLKGEGFIAHSTAKSGLDAFIKSLALELGPHGIRANVVSPGLTLTDATARLPQKYKDASAQMVP